MEPNQLQSDVDRGDAVVRPRLSRVFGAVAGLALIATPAMAQAQRLVPPENKDGIDGRAWISGFVLLLVLAMVLFGAFLKTKRGHQD